MKYDQISPDDFIVFIIEYVMKFSRKEVASVRGSMRTVRLRLMGAS